MSSPYAPDPSRYISCISVVRDTLPEQDEKSRFAISETMYEKSALSVYKVVT
jgi:hypothetical protein